MRLYHQNIRIQRNTSICLHTTCLRRVPKLAKVDGCSDSSCTSFFRKKLFNKKSKMSDRPKSCPFPRILVPPVVLKLTFPLGSTSRILHHSSKELGMDLPCVSKHRQVTLIARGLGHSSCEQVCHYEHYVYIQINTYYLMLPVFVNREAILQQKRGRKNWKVINPVPATTVDHATRVKPGKIHNDLYSVITISPSHKLHLMTN